MRVAVLALQGAFIEHERMLESLGAEVFEVRNLEDWNQPKDALVIPGGESTAIGRIMHDEGLLEPIRNEILNGLPVMGTCAGMILLSQRSLEASGVESQNYRLATMDIMTMRNAYGRQLGSFNTAHPVEGISNGFPMTFIRAPYIAEVGEGVNVLSEVEGRIVAACQGNQLAIAFHPELTTDTRIHEYFLSMVNK